MISTLPIAGAGTPVGAAPTPSVSSFAGSLLLAAQPGADALPLDFKTIAATLFGNQTAGLIAAEPAGKSSSTALGSTRLSPTRIREKSVGISKTDSAGGPTEPTQPAPLPVQTLLFAPYAATGMSSLPAANNPADVSSLEVDRTEQADVPAVQEIKTSAAPQGFPGSVGFGSVSETDPALRIATSAPAAGFSWMRATPGDRGVERLTNQQMRQPEIQPNAAPSQEPAKDSLAAPVALSVPPVPSGKDPFPAVQVEQAPVPESNVPQGNFNVAQAVQADAKTNSASVETMVKSVAPSIGRAMRETPAPLDGGVSRPKQNEVQADRAPFPIPREFSDALQSSAWSFQTTSKSIPVDAPFSASLPLSNIREGSHAVTSDAQTPQRAAQSATPTTVDGVSLKGAPAQPVEDAPLPDHGSHGRAVEAKINQPLPDGVHPEPTDRSAAASSHSPVSASIQRLAAQMQSAISLPAATNTEAPIEDAKLQAAQASTADAQPQKSQAAQPEAIEASLVSNQSAPANPVVQSGEADVAALAAQLLVKPVEPGPASSWKETKPEPHQRESGGSSHPDPVFSSNGTAPKTIERPTSLPRQYVVLPLAANPTKVSLPAGVRPDQLTGPPQNSGSDHVNWPLAKTETAPGNSDGRQTGMQAVVAANPAPVSTLAAALPQVSSSSPQGVGSLRKSEQVRIAADSSDDGADGQTAIAVTVPDHANANAAAASLPLSSPSIPANAPARGNDTTHPVGDAPSKNKDRHESNNATPAISAFTSSSHPQEPNTAVVPSSNASANVNGNQLAAVPVPANSGLHPKTTRSKDSATTAPGIPQIASVDGGDGDVAIAGHPAINTAKLIQGMSQSEVRVGVLSREFGNIDIRTSVERHQFTAQISVEHNEMAKSLALELPSLYSRLAEQKVPVANLVIQNQSASTSSGFANNPQSQAGSRQANNTVGFQTEPTLSLAPELLAPVDRLDIRI